ncbi:MAG: hypothetical protein COB49_01515 [Alphaproteobacteria bacterium]|nr:MAG: hypothetical protein COB49_01515 [Alphaproteobacteria bacterium]
MNYMKLFGIAAFAIGAILYMASSDDHMVVMGEQDYGLDEFIKVSVNILADVNVQVGKDYGLNVKADEKDLKYIKIYVKGQTLVIENKKNHFSSWYGDPPEITISMPKMKKITLNGSADVDIKDIHGSYFIVVVNGSGQVDFEGSSEELKVEVNGSGSLSSASFNARESQIDVNGSGSVALAGECRELEVNIYGSGNFAGKNYKCNDVDAVIFGSGDLDVFASGSLEVDVKGAGEVNVYGKPMHVKDRTDKKSHVTIR